jgi:hypothetical protein
MEDYIDFEMGFFRQDQFSYHVELRYDDPVDASQSLLEIGRFTVDVQELNSFLLDPEKYGQALTARVFQDENIKRDFEAARKTASERRIPLRLRLFIHRTAPELHELHWETLRNPQDGSWLLADENVLFSRFLRSTTWNQPQRRPKGLVRTLVAVASPGNINDYSDETGHPLAKVQPDQEVLLASKALQGMPVVTLGDEPGAENRCSLENIIERLRQGFDILYLVCHGAIRRDANPPGPVLYLEYPDGTTHPIPGITFVEKIKNLPPRARPTLVVLASCQSADMRKAVDASDSGGLQSAFLSVGPKLAEIGVPAVLAMQGSISVDTVEQFMQPFFEQLLKDGQIDRAMAVARSQVLDRPDHWMPVLFLRLRDGRIWSGTTAGTEEFESWPSLIDAILSEKCTVILGPGLSESLIGTRRDIALNWAEESRYPLSPYDREDFARVAQFVELWQSKDYLHRHLADAIRLALREYYPELIDDQLLRKPTWNWTEIGRVTEAVAKKTSSGESTNPFDFVARLRLPIYMTAHYLDFLPQAMARLDVNIKPQVAVCPWNPMIEDEHTQFSEEPSSSKPWIFHLYGRYNSPESLVLTEDDFFDYLIGITKNNEKIEKKLKGALVKTSLLFLGFRVDDWTFRALFRIISNLDGSLRLREKVHAAVQITPDENRILDFRRTRHYLERYFQPNNINLYWGSLDDFLRELVERTEAARSSNQVELE